MKFRGYFHPSYVPRTTGFNKTGGEFWIGFLDDEDNSGGMIRIELTVPAEHSPSNATYASIHVHHDGVKAIRKLEEIGFLEIFETIQASTFYDVVQCCARCDVPIIYYGGDYVKEVMPRKFYELLHNKETA